MSNYQSYSSYVEPADYQEPAPVEPVRVHNTVHRTSSTDGDMAYEGAASNARGSVEELNPHYGTDSIFASATSGTGMPVYAIKADTLITVEGVQAPVSFWVEQGYVKQAADGTFSEARGGPAEVPQEAGTEEIASLTPAAVDCLNDALSPLHAGQIEGLVGTVVGAATGRVDESALAQKFAQMSGLEISESHERVTAVREVFQAQADQALNRAGVAAADLPAFYAWCQKQQQGRLGEAVQRQIWAQDVSGYRSLASQWLAATAPSVQALKAAGLSVREQGKAVEVYVQGNWMSPGAASRMGLI